MPSTPGCLFFAVLGGVCCLPVKCGAARQSKADVRRRQRVSKPKKSPHVLSMSENITGRNNSVHNRTHETRQSSHIQESTCSGNPIPNSIDAQQSPTNCFYKKKCTKYKLGPSSSSPRGSAKCSRINKMNAPPPRRHSFPPRVCAFGQKQKSPLRGETREDYGRWEHQPGSHKGRLHRSLFLFFLDPSSTVVLFLFIFIVTTEGFSGPSFPTSTFVSSSVYEITNNRFCSTPRYSVRKKYQFLSCFSPRFETTITIVRGCHKGCAETQGRSDACVFSSTENRKKKQGRK